MLLFGMEDKKMKRVIAVILSIVHGSVPVRLLFFRQRFRFR